MKQFLLPDKGKLKIHFVFSTCKVITTPCFCFMCTQLLEALDDDPSAKKMNLSSRFEQVSQAIEGTRLYH